MDRKRYLSMRIFIVLMLLVVAVACSSTQKPSNSLVEEAVKAQLNTSVPERWIEASIPGEKPILKSIEIEEWGVFNTEGNYWPVKVRVIGSAELCFWCRGKPEIKEFNEIAEFKFFKDDYGEWKWKFLKPGVFGGEMWVEGRKLKVSPNKKTTHTPNSEPVINLRDIEKAKTDIRSMEAALNLYKLDNYVYPTSDQGLKALIQKPSSPEPPNWKDGGYLDRLPLDPWQQTYLYMSPGKHGSVDIYSQGPDKVPSDDDIGNW